MSRDNPKTKTLAVPASVASGAAIDVAQLFKYSKWVTVSSIGVATYKVEVSNDGTNFVQSGVDKTADFVLEVKEGAKYLRVRCSAYTSGTPVGSVYGIETAPE